MSERQSGPSDRKTLQLRGLRCQQLQEQGRLVEAEAEARELLAAMAKAYGPDRTDPDLLVAIDTLATILIGRGQLREAIELLRQELAAISSNPTAPRPWITEGNLGQALSDAGDFNAAETVLRAAAEGAVKAFGADHAESIVIRINLAVLLHRTNRNGEAEPILREALAAQGRVFSTEHPRVLSTQTSLASVLRACGKLHESRALLEQTLAAQRLILEPDHADLLLTSENLANLLVDLGDLQSAESLQREVVTQQRKTAATGPDAIDARFRLARILLKLDRLAEAERELLAAHEESVGSGLQQSLPEVQRVISSLVALYTQQGREADAEPWRARVEGTRR